MNLNLTTATRIGLNLLALLGIAVSLYLGASIFVPLVLSVLLASILFPPARFLNARLRVPWFFACVVPLLAAVALFLVVLVAFGIAVPRTIEALPKDPKGWEERYEKIVANLNQIVPFSLGNALPPEAKDSQVYKVVKELFSENNAADAVKKIAAHLVEYVVQAILIMFITLFLLLEGQMLSDKVRAIFGPSRETQDRVTKAIAEMAEAVRVYLVWRTIVNLGLAIVLGVVYQAARLEYWYLWALLVAVLSYVPYIGTIAAGIPPVLDALIFVDPAMAIGIGIFYTGVVTFEGYIIVPWVMGRSMDLNATTVLLACLLWNLLWGIPGLFLAMPLMAAVKAVCMQVEGWQGWGDLMSSGPAKPLRLESDPGNGGADAKGGSPSAGDSKSNGNGG
jgi:predicted PurR-regulated permease PerM